MIETKTLLPGVTLRSCRDDRFKQGCLSFQLVRPMAKEESAKNVLIPSVLLRGTKRCPDLRAITENLDELYGASVSPLVRRVGDYQTTGLYCGFMDDRFALPGDRVLAPMLRFLEEILLDFPTEGEGFLPAFVEGEKKNLISTIDSELNDKRTYAMGKLLKTMCRGDSFGLPRLGEPEDVAETERSAANLEDVLLDAQEELKATKRQRVRDIMRHPENEAVLDETYDELEADLMRKIEGLQSQIEHVTDRRNTIIRANRAAKTAMEVFDDIITKPHLEKQDLELIIERIRVYEDRVEIQLKADIDTLLRRGELPEPDTEPVTVVQASTHHPDRTISANVVNEGDPLEIFTDKDGEVIFKKYSPIGELSDFAAQICDSLHKSTDCIAAVCDRDAVIAVAGGGRRELFEKRISPELEQIMESRRVFRHESGGACVPVTDSDSGFCVSVAAPVVSEGDLMGAVIFASPKNAPPSGDVEFKLAQTVAAFLGKQMES